MKATMCKERWPIGRRGSEVARVIKINR